MNAVSAPSVVRPSARSVTLVSHHAHPGESVRNIVVQAARAAPDSLRFHYAIEGDIDRLRIPMQEPAAGPGERADGLWKRTCFEAFVASAAAEDGRYCELNFSPSHAWAAYGFSSYRAGMTMLDIARPDVSVSRERDALRLEATIALPAIYRTGTLRLALAAVIEDDRGALSYWALRHAAGKPDFHHRDSFVLEI